jgi:hypothetical protein
MQIISICLFVLHEQLFSYLATVTIAGNRAANLDSCLALMGLAPRLLRHGTSVFKVISVGPVILTSEYRTLGEEVITTYSKHFRFYVAVTNGARTHDLPDAKQEHYY